MSTQNSEEHRKGFRIVATTSPVTKRTRFAVWSANGVHLKSFYDLETARAHIDAIAQMVAARARKRAEGKRR